MQGSTKSGSTDSKHDPQTPWSCTRRALPLAALKGMHQGVTWRVQVHGRLDHWIRLLWLRLRQPMRATPSRAAVEARTVVAKAALAEIELATVAKLKAAAEGAWVDQGTTFRVHVRLRLASVGPDS